MEKTGDTEKAKTLDDIHRDLYDVMGAIAVTRGFASQRADKEDYSHIRDTLDLVYEKLEAIQEDIDAINSEMIEHRKE
jgi:cob(I)alamin adenosyltransferase